jgi:hypothetical protein
VRPERWQQRLCPLPDGIAHFSWSCPLHLVTFLAPASFSRSPPPFSHISTVSEYAFNARLRAMRHGSPARRGGLLLLKGKPHQYRIWEKMFPEITLHDVAERAGLTLRTR